MHQTKFAVELHHWRNFATNFSAKISFPKTKISQIYPLPKKQLCLITALPIIFFCQNIFSPLIFQNMFSAKISCLPTYFGRKIN
jgi:hypothetical protein